MLPYIIGAHVGYTPADRGATREVEFMGRAMDRVVLNGSRNIETCLFKAQAHSPSARKQIYADRSLTIALHLEINSLKTFCASGRSRNLDSRAFEGSMQTSNSGCGQALNAVQEKQRVLIFKTPVEGE
jgi:hypothetical protein